MSGPSNIGSSASNPQGLLNAFAAVNKLANIATGSIFGPAMPAGATLSTPRFNTLADILAVCVNSAGGTAGDSSTCGNLFSYATVNGTAPTDTITAAMNIAQHPNTQVAALVGMASPTAPFQPTLASTPNDLQLVISYSSGGFSTPRGIAADASGNVWVPNAAANTVTQLNNSGAPLSGTSGYSVAGLNQPSAIAIDLSGNAWVANTGNNTVSEIGPSGSAGPYYSGGGLNAPNSIAIDAAGDVWAANGGNSTITEIIPFGSVTGYTPSGVAAPIGIAIDSH
jgi:streptogramin lyase